MKQRVPSGTEITKNAYTHMHMHFPMQPVRAQTTNNFCTPPCAEITNEHVVPLGYLLTLMLLFMLIVLDRLAYTLGSPAGKALLHVGCASGVRWEGGLAPGWRGGCALPFAWASLAAGSTGARPKAGAKPQPKLALPASARFSLLPLPDSHSAALRSQLGLYFGYCLSLFWSPLASAGARAHLRTLILIKSASFVLSALQLRTGYPPPASYRWGVEQEQARLPS